MSFNINPDLKYYNYIHSCGLKEYQNTSVIPETLFRISEALLKTGLIDEAKKSIALLNYNFPDSNWTKLSKSLLDVDLNKNINNGFTNKFKNYLKAPTIYSWGFFYILLKNSLR